MTVYHIYGGSVIDYGAPTILARNALVGIFATKAGGSNLATDPSLTNVDGTPLGSAVAVIDNELTPFGDTVDRDLFIVGLDGNGNETGSRVLMLPSNQRQVNSSLSAGIAGAVTKAAVLATGLAPADIGAATTGSVTTAIGTAEAASDAAGTAAADVATEVTNRNTAIAAEATLRISGDATNATAVTNEATARAAADTSETSARSAAIAALAAGLATKPPVVVVSTTNIVSRSGLPTIDGVTLTAGQRVLLVGQTAGSSNGIWLVASGSWTRPTDYATSADATGSVAYVESGTVNAGSTYAVTGGGPYTIDTNVTTWVLQTALGEVTAGTGISKSGNTLSADLTVVAPLASPALTGNPTAPTPSPGDNDTSVATTAFTTAAIAAQHVIDSGAYVAQSSVGAVSGVAPLDSSQLVPVANLPVSTAILLIPVVGVPGSGVGLNGDYAWDVSTGNVYGPKALGAWGSIIATLAPGLAAPVLFTSSGTWTPVTTGQQLFRATLVGGGGGGKVGTSTLGGGSGGGGEVLDDFYLGHVTTAQTVTIGAGGAAASNGNPTSIGALVTAAAGQGATGQPGGACGDGTPGINGGLTGGIFASSGAGGGGGGTTGAGTRGGPGLQRLGAGGGAGGGPTSGPGAPGGSSTGGTGGTGASNGGGGGGAAGVNGGNGSSGVGGQGATAAANTGGGGGGGGSGTTPGAGGAGGSGFAIISQVA